MNSVSIRINDLDFNVSRDGTIHQPMSVPGVILDEVRLQAADHFLADKTLGSELRGYWKDIATVTPETKRGGYSGGGKRS